MTKPPDRPAASPDLAARLRDLAGRIGRLLPDWQKPERFFESRSDLAGELHRLATEAEPAVRSRAGWP